MAESETQMTVAAEYTIDELAAHTKVPSRTIRFYQSKGALPKPEIRGRKAVYIEAHVARLGLIGTLQDRGLRIRAIRDLVGRIDRGELDLQQWLGLQDKLHRPLVEEAPTLYTAAELQALAGTGRAHLVADLARLGLVTPTGDRFLAQSPALLTAMLQMEQSGVDLAVAKGAMDLAKKNLAKLSNALVKHYVAHAGSGFGRTASTTDLTEAFEAVPTRTREVVAILFGQEMERALGELVSSGAVAKLVKTED